MPPDKGAAHAGAHAEAHAEAHPNAGAAFTAEDIITAEIAATLAGALHGAQGGEAVVEYLKLIGRLEGAEDESAARIAQVVRERTYKALPTPQGVVPVKKAGADLSDLSDLSFTSRLFRGIFSPFVTYVENDHVEYQNQEWQALQPSIGITPEEGDYWTLVPPEAQQQPQEEQPSPRDEQRRGDNKRRGDANRVGSPRAREAQDIGTAGGGGNASPGYAREMLFRARFAANSFKRLYRAEREGGQEGLKAQLAREDSYYKAHRRVSEHRESHLALLDEAARQWGDLLSWRAVLDGRTTAECRAAHGKNFRITSPPMIGLPGLVHPLCRCVAGPPRNNAPLI